MDNGEEKKLTPEQISPSGQEKPEKSQEQIIRDLESGAKKLVVDFNQKGLDFVNGIRRKEGITDEEIRELQIILKKYNDAAEEAFNAMMDAIKAQGKDSPEAEAAKDNWRRLRARNQKVYEMIEKGGPDLKIDLKKETMATERKTDPESLKKEIGQPGRVYRYEKGEIVEHIRIAGYEEKYGKVAVIIEVTDEKGKPIERLIHPAENFLELLDHDREYFKITEPEVVKVKPAGENGGGKPHFESAEEGKAESEEAADLQAELKSWHSLWITGDIWSDYDRVARLSGMKELGEKRAGTEGDPEKVINELQNLRKGFEMTHMIWFENGRKAEDFKNPAVRLLNVDIPREAIAKLDEMISYYKSILPGLRDKWENIVKPMGKKEEEAKEGEAEVGQEKKPEAEAKETVEKQPEAGIEADKKVVQEPEPEEEGKDPEVFGLTGLEKNDVDFLREKSPKYKANYIKIKERSQGLLPEEVDEFIRCSEMGEAKKLLDADMERLVGILKKEPADEELMGKIRKIISSRTEKEIDKHKDKNKEITHDYLLDKLKKLIWPAKTKKKSEKEVIEELAENEEKRRRKSAGLENIENEEYKDLLDEIAENTEKDKSYIAAEIKKFLETAQILKELAAKTGIPVEDDVDGGGKIIHRGLKSIIAAQEQAFYDQAREKVFAKNKGRRIAVAIGKSVAYVGAGVGLGIATAATSGGALAVLGGAAGLRGLRIADRLASNKWEERKIRQEIGVLKNGIDSEGLKTGLLAQIATLKQAQIDGHDEENYENDMRLAKAEKEYLDKPSVSGKENLNRILDEKQSIFEQDLRTYFLNAGKTPEEAERQIKQAMIMYRIGENDGLELKLSEKNNNRFLKRIGKKLDSFSRGKGAKEQAVNAAVYTGMGAIARELPVIRTILMGVAGAKGGEAFASWRTGGKNTHEMLKMVRHNEIRDNKAKDAVNLARLQLRDEEFKIKNPKEYALLKQEMDALEAEKSEKAKIITAYLQGRETQIEKTGEDKKKVLDDVKKKKRVYMAVGALIGAGASLLGELVKDHLAIKKIIEEPEKPDGGRAEVPEAEIPGTGTEKPEAKGSGPAKEFPQYEPGPYSGKPDSELIPPEAEKVPGFKEPAGIRPEKELEKAIVREGKGIEHSLIRQLKDDPGKFGYKGSLEDAKSVSNWANAEAHRLAIKAGYVDSATHRQIWVNSKGIDSAAYELAKDKAGGNVIREYFRDPSGSFRLVEEKNLSGGSLPFETDREEYEMEMRKGGLAGDKAKMKIEFQPKEDIAPEGSDQNQHVYEDRQRDMINKLANERIGRRTEDIYKYSFGSQHKEWEIMKDMPARDIIDKNYGPAIDTLGIDKNGLDPQEIRSLETVDLAERNNRAQLRQYLLEAKEAMGRSPYGTETVEEYLTDYEEHKVLGEFNSDLGIGNPEPTVKSGSFEMANAIDLSDSNEFVRSQEGLVKQAIAENDAEYFTGLNKGEIVKDPENLEKGIVKIKYPAGHPLDELTINFKSKYITIDNPDYAMPWRWDPKVNSMEKLRDFINSHLLSKIEENSKA